MEAAVCGVGMTLGLEEDAIASEAYRIAGLPNTGRGRSCSPWAKGVITAACKAVSITGLVAAAAIAAIMSVSGVFSSFVAILGFAAVEQVVQHNLSRGCAAVAEGICELLQSRQVLAT
jgi:hypothetical protein